MPKRFGAFLLGAALISALIPKKTKKAAAPARTPSARSTSRPFYALVQIAPQALVLAISDSPSDLEAEMLELNETWNRTDLRPSDVDTAQIYDGFSILTLMWLEGLQFCGHGESGAFVENGKRISLGGDLPINTNGGQLSAGRTHSVGYVHEACLQLWGRANGRQIKDAQVAVTSAGGGPLGGSLLLVRE